ncbi:ACP S-malonyltransferase [Nocardia transvalensis]|nr:ACP S-malonyltransferase [Nocardia transvalensis]MBF6329925.1 ACP S-malonyltransferase [Nocardia transvalensis]
MFPGQGSQRAGMADHLLREYPQTVGPIFAEADEVLGLPLTELCLTGDAVDLTRTEVAQPAILATSIATYSILAANGFRPEVVAGHSLGEFSALVAAGVLTFADALALVRRRGQLMGGVADRIPGAMVAILGIPAGDVEQICVNVAAATGGVVEVANLNAPTQTVISGSRGAVAAAARQARQAGADRTVRLDVGAPFHCSLMLSIAEEFSDELATVPFSDPCFPVLSSVTASVVKGGEHARRLLRCQLAGPVRWTELLCAARWFAVDYYLEVGPGRVLSGFVDRTGAEAAVHSTNDARRLAAVLHTLQASVASPRKAVRK